MELAVQCTEDDGLYSRNEGAPGIWMVIKCSPNYQLLKSCLQVSTHYHPECSVLDQLPPNLYLLGIIVAKQLGLKRFAGS